MITSPPIELVIFDCDGVLVDSERISIHVEAEVLAELGWPLPPEEILARFVGRTDDDIRAQIEHELGRSVPEWKAMYEERAFQAFAAQLRPVPGIEAALDALDRQRRATCVASSGSHARMRRTLGITGLFQRFEGRIFSASEVARGKPAPDVFLHAAARMSVTPDRCVVVEDSAAGVAAAYAAGMRCFGYSGGLTPAGWLDGPGTVVFDDMTALAGLIDRG